MIQAWRDCCCAQAQCSAESEYTAVSHAGEEIPISAYRWLDGSLVQSGQLCLYQHLDVKAILKTACMSANYMQSTQLRRS